MMLVFSAASFFLILSGCSGFAPRQMQERRSRSLPPPKAQVMADMDIMCLVNTADLCSREEDMCDLEHEEALMNTLGSQMELMEIRLEELREMVFALAERPRVDAANRHHTSAPVMNEMDAMCLMNTADYCINEGCDLDQKEALVNRLSEQYSALNLRHTDIVASLKRLEAHSLGSRMRMHDRETESLMQSIQRRLSMEYGDANNRVPVAGHAFE
mmetsp:Transcript_66756/g.192843  ORF Transcript_66756/g.192843 Transcript_66756/m.192843 type:complete len:215 (-) Transcript_66756:8-652(-)